LEMLLLVRKTLYFGGFNIQNMLRILV